jgi:hypothetical protein
MSPRDLLSLIETTMDAPGATAGAGLAARHPSMRAVLDGSWQWLGDKDRSVLAGLAVFVGGFTCESARQGRKSDGRRSTRRSGNCVDDSKPPRPLRTIETSATDA